NIRPRETITLGLEVREVERIAAELTALAVEAKGRSVESNVAHEANGTKTANLTLDVPLDKADGVLARFKGAGIVRAQRSIRNPQVPDSSLAIARINLVLTNETPIVASDEGVGSSIRSALAFSLKGLFASLVFVVTGLIMVGPWALMAYVLIRIALRL